MKNSIVCLFTSALFFAFTSSNAQIQKRSFRVGGGASYSKTVMNDNMSYASISFTPSISYFPIDNLSVGAALLLSSSDVKSGIIEYANSQYSIGPQVRYYFPFGKWALFPEVIYSFGKTTSEYSDFFSGDPLTQKTETKFSAFRVGAGITYFISNTVGIEGIVFYQNNEQEAINPFSIVAYDKSINFNIGFHVYLNRE